MNSRLTVFPQSLAYPPLTTVDLKIVAAPKQGAATLLATVAACAATGVLTLIFCQQFANARQHLGAVEFNRVHGVLMG